MKASAAPAFSRFRENYGAHYSQIRKIQIAKPELNGKRDYNRPFAFGTPV